jgi:hypothetical protein
MKRILLCLGLLLASAQLFAQDDADKYKPVERNRRMPFVTAESYVKQDNKVIVNYATEPIGESGTSFTFTLPNGTVVAVGVLKRTNGGKITVQTKQDEKMHTVGLKNISDMDVAREVAMFLSDNKYL